MHGPLKRILKLNTSEQWNDWHKYGPLATFIHNTSYHSVNCCPSTLFHGREPVKPLDLRFSRKGIEACEANSDYVLALQDAILQKFGENKQRLLDSYQRYRSYYDYKSIAQLLQKHSHCLLLNAKIATQSDFTQKSVQTWLPLYRVEQVLTNSNYISRKVGTNYTQCVHRIRLRPTSLNSPPDDLDTINPDNFEADPSRRTTRNEPDLFDEFIPNLLEEDQNAAFSQQQEAAPAQIRLSVPIAVPRVPIAHSPHPVPPPVPALPPRPMVRPPVNIAPSPPSSSNSSARSSDLENSDNAEPPLPFNIPDSPQSEPETEQPPENDPESPDEQPCTSTTSYDKSVNFAQKRRIRTYEKWQPAARYGERFRKSNLPPSPSQPAILTSEEKRKIIHESSQRALRNPTPSRETKLDQV